MKMNRNLAIIILSLVVIICAVFLLVPEYTMFNQLNHELGLKLAQLDPSNTYYAEVKKVDAALLARSSDLQKVNDALPDSPDLSRIIYFLQLQATQNGLTIKNAVLSKSSLSSQNQPEGIIKDIVFSVSLSGSYQSLNKFIIALESSDRIFEITNISFTSTTPVTQLVLASPFSSQRVAVTTQPPFDFNIQVKTHSY